MEEDEGCSHAKGWADGRWWRWRARGARPRPCSTTLTLCALLPMGGRWSPWSSAAPATGCLSCPSSLLLLLLLSACLATRSLDITSERTPHVGQGTSSEGTGRRQLAHQCLR